jgi:hypothetical protein
MYDVSMLKEKQSKSFTEIKIPDEKSAYSRISQSLVRLSIVGDYLF